MALPDSGFFLDLESRMSIFEEIVAHLNHLNWKLVTAESCTGGLIASKITDIPGSSSWFERGFVTYSNLSKQQMLDVPEQIIQTFGAVSEETAIAMAEGALKRSAGQISLAVTGIAGPGGGTENKPVGTVCFAWATSGIKTRSQCQFISGDRAHIRVISCDEALKGVLSILREIA